ncbi:hypothetical protein GGF46_004899 [Coemansia sp. RSA 552]|nr:hypothetical protein GGF46_004899 [Coemansia sp. RSA 552]
MSQASRFGRVAGVLKTSGVRIGAGRGFHSSVTRQLDATAIEPVVAEVTQKALQVGDLAAYGLDVMWLTRMMAYGLEYVHVTTGLPWWGTIVAMVVGVRVALLPVSVWSQRHMVRSMSAQPQMSALLADVKEATARKDHMAVSMHSQQLSKFRKENNVSLVKPLVGNVLVIPFMMGMFFALQEMATLPFTGLSTGGHLWITNLAAPDPYYLLPLISAASTSLSMEMNSRFNTATVQSKEMKYMMRAMVGMGAIVTSQFPAAVLLFWLSNSVWTCAQALLLHSWVGTKVLGIPHVKKHILARPKKNVMESALGDIINRKKTTGFAVKHKKL